MADQKIHIVNRKAKFEYELLDKFTAGMQLLGTEIKSIRAGKATIAEAYCTFQKEELFIKGMHVAEYLEGTYNNHEPTRPRKLLLTKRELKKLQAKVTEKGHTIVPLQLFISDRGFAKLDLALARGKKTHDKRHSIKEKDIKRDMDREMRNYK